MSLTGLSGCDALMKKLNFENMVSMTPTKYSKNTVLSGFSTIYWWPWLPNREEKSK